MGGFCLSSLVPRSATSTCRVAAGFIFQAGFIFHNPGSFALAAETGSQRPRARSDVLPGALLPPAVGSAWNSKELKVHEAGLGLGDFLSGKKKFKATLCFNLMWLYDDEKKHLQLQSLSSTRYCHSHRFLFPSLTLPSSPGLCWELLPCAVCNEIRCELLEFLHSNQRRNGL